jgi:hypothetical protein
MAITSARAFRSAHCSHGRREIPGSNRGRRMIMITIITLALFAIALALSGLIALVVNVRTIDQSTLLSDLWKS